MHKNYFGIFTVLLLSFFTIKPLLINGFFPMHDDTQVSRVFEMTKSLRDGMFPVRWVSDLGYGYGYPIFNFYAPFAYYVGSFFNLLGFDSLIATKIMIGISIVLAGLGMYLFVKLLWGEKAGIISAILYVYAPYHALDIYVRGAISELWAYAFIPFIFYSILGLAQKRKNRFIVIFATSFAGLILSHNLSAFMSIPFIIIFLLYQITTTKFEREIFIKKFLLGLILGVVISGFYWIPALSEMRYTNVISQVGGGADFKDHFVCLLQLWDSPWAFGGSIPGCVDGLSFKVGKVHILFAFISLLIGIWLWIKRKYDKKMFNDILPISTLLLLSIVLTHEVSYSLWDSIHFMAFIQYPWRFLLFTSFFISVLGSFFFVELERNTKNQILIISIFIIAIIGILGVNGKLFHPQYITSYALSYYTDEENLKWRVSKISDEYMPSGFQKPRSLEEVPSTIVSGPSAIKITNVSRKTGNFSFTIHTSEEKLIIINLAYFPGWEISINKKKVDYKQVKNGIEVLIPQGTNQVSANFVPTMIEKTAGAVSLIGIIALITGIIYSQKKKTW